MIKNRKQIKKIQFYPSIYKLHTAYKSLLTNPPEGYKFLDTYDPKYLTRKFKGCKILKKIYRLLTKLLQRDLSQKIIKKQRISEEGDLIFSTGVLYYGNKPWVLDIIDCPYSLAGYNYNIFFKNKDRIEKKLLEDNCIAVICANESSISFMKKHFSTKLFKKTILIHPGIKVFKMNKKKKGKNYFQILFMGSLNNPDDFLIKGGLETLETFKKLSEKYSNIKLIMKCKLPKGVREKYSMKNMVFIEEILPYEKVLKLYLDSDILLMPGHCYFLMAFLESMSFGLPIVALDTYAVKDYVIDKKTGFLIKPSKNFPYANPFYPTNLRNKEFINSILRGDTNIVNDLANKVELLIKNPKLKQKLGKEGKRIAETKFSIKKRNDKLKKIFDEALE